MVRDFLKLSAPLARRVRLLVGRGILRLVNDGLKLQGVQVSLLADEVHDNVERFQEYGFTSHPHPGAETIAVCVGGSRDHAVVISIDDRRYRLKGLGAGEVALYDDQGQVIRLKRNKEIHAYGCDRLMADVAVETVVTCPLIRAVASSKVVLDAPLVEATGNVHVAGGITCAGTYGDTGGKIVTPGDIESTAGEVRDQVRAMSADRQIYNGHTHPGDSGGTTGAPDQGM